MASDVKNEIFKKLAKSAVRKGVELSPYILVDILYKKIFDHKTISDPIKRFEIDDFPLLIREKVIFKSGDHLLTGYFYNYCKYDSKKIVIFSHGYGNGHHRYLEIIDYLAKNGFYVFSYDATSFDESEGEGINGFPQGVVDVSSAIKFIKNSKGYKEEDIILVGHSWGAYSIGAAINEYPHISKVVSFAGFNNAIDLIKAHGNEWAGQKIDEQVPIMEEHEKKDFGKVASYTVLEGIKDSTTKYFFIHSEDDEVVPIEIGLNLYHKDNENNPRVRYKRFKDRTHICYNTKEGNDYFNHLKSEYAKYSKDKELLYEDKKHLLDLIVDKNKYLNMLNYPLLDEVIKFIKE